LVTRDTRLKRSQLQVGQQPVDVGSMSTYRLYKSPRGDIVRVKMGFSWQAFFVGSLKAIVHRTWLLAVVGALFYFGSAFYGGAPTATSRTAALVLVVLGFYAVYMLFCGVNGNRWLGDSLRRRGFTLVGEERR
jgi:fatty acid desaturase